MRFQMVLDMPWFCAKKALAGIDARASGSATSMRGIFLAELFAAQRGDKAEGDGQDDGDDRCQAHAFEGNRANRDAGCRDAKAQDDGGQHEVDRLVVVNLAFDEHADTRSGNDAEQQHRYTAHDRRRDALDDSGKLAEAREEDGKDRRAADDPGREDLRDGEHADVLAVSRVRRRAEEARDNRRDTVAED